MNIERNERGFHSLVHPVYIPKDDSDNRIITESSAIGNYEDSFEKPGSSYLWFGRDHHLNREEVAKVVKFLQRWLKTGSLEK